MSEILIIGAGVAGLTAARELKDAGYSVRVFEKSRGLGGRSATRRVEGVPFDHGAQYFTARDARFKAQVARWLEQKQVEVWAQGFHRLTKRGLEPPGQGHPRYICSAGMNTLGKLLAEGLEVWQTRATSLRAAGDGWVVETENGEEHNASRVIVNMPAPQAAALCAGALEPALTQALEAVEMAPCFALAAAFSAALAPAWLGIEIATGPLGWLAHDSSKRGGVDQTVLMLHSTPDFASEAFEQDPDEVKAQMLERLKEIDPRYTQPRWTSFQRWRYARVVRPHTAPCLRQAGLFFCGDWCGGSTLEAAYISGLTAANSLIDAG